MVADAGDGRLMLFGGNVALCGEAARLRKGLLEESGRRLGDGARSASMAKTVLLAEGSIGGM